MPRLGLRDITSTGSAVCNSVIDTVAFDKDPSTVKTDFLEDHASVKSDTDIDSFVPWWLGLSANRFYWDF